MQRPNEENQPFPRDEVLLDGDQSQHKSGISRKWIWLVLLVLAIVTAGTLAIFKQSGSNKGAERAGTATTRANERSPGSEVLLYLEGRNAVMVAVDEQSLDELINALASNREEVQKLIDSERVFSMPNNTRVRVVEANFAKLKVRFLEGERVMSEAWVPERWVR